MFSKNKKNVQNNKMRLFNLLLFLIFISIIVFPTYGYTYSGNISSYSQSTFQSGISSDMTITACNTGSTVDFAVEPAIIPSGWTVYDKEWEFPDNNYVLKNVGYWGCANFVFQITPPATGGSGTITWKLSAVYNCGWFGCTWSQLQTKNQSINTPPPAAPTNISASDGYVGEWWGWDKNKVRISWTGVSQSTKYYVYRSTSSSSGTASKIGETTGTAYDDTNTTAASEVKYYYWVSSYNSAGEN